MPPYNKSLQSISQLYMFKTHRTFAQNSQTCAGDNYKSDAKGDFNLKLPFRYFKSLSSFDKILNNFHHLAAELLEAFNSSFYMIRSALKFMQCLIRLAAFPTGAINELGHQKQRSLGKFSPWGNHLDN